MRSFRNPGSIQAAIESYETVRASYRGIVLAALRSVADALSTLQADADVLIAATQTKDLARRAPDAPEVHYRAGGLPYVNLFLTQAQNATAILMRLSVQVQRLTDTVTLVQALGGGWHELKPS